MEQKYKALIVDDERLARQALKENLLQFPEIEVVAEANNITAAADAIIKYNPDIIFLDIQMPGETGFDLFDKTEITGNVIFVTAFDSYAIRAFEVNASDYLLKPINPVRLKQSLNRIFNKEKTADKQVGVKLKPDDKVLIKVNSRVKFIQVSAIQSIIAMGDYSQINMIDKSKYSVNTSLSEWEDKLPEQMFLRIHRSTIINLELIEKTERSTNGAFFVFLNNVQTPFIMSKRFVTKIRRKYSINLMSK